MSAKAAAPHPIQALGPVFAAWYLHLSWQWWIRALGGGCVAAAMASWATRSAKDAPPVRAHTCFTLFLLQACFLLVLSAVLWVRSASHGLSYNKGSSREGWP